MSNQSHKGCVISCKCGKSEITLADGKAKLKLQCGCMDCRQALEYGFINGGVRPDPLPELYYMPSELTGVRGKDFMKAFRLREDDPNVTGMSTRIYCTECYSILGADHPAYQSNVFVNFPKHCENSGDLSAPLSAYVMMTDYSENIGPLPTEDIPLFTTFRFQQEAERFFAMPVIADAFCARTEPLKGITFSQLVDELEPVTVLGLEKGEKLGQD